MSQASEDRSGLPLLVVYTVLVVIGATLAIAGFFAVAALAPSFSDIIFVVLLLAAIIVPWPVALAIEEKMANKNANAVGSVG